jgi:glycosyltransferase involved in cell wall biosynthesis
MGISLAGSCTVVIPTYNEKGNVVKMAEAIRKAYPEFKILFMDDNSDDGTIDLVRGLNDPLTEIRPRK